MKKVILVGAGGTGERLYKKLKNTYDIVAFWDNDVNKKQLLGKPVFTPNKLQISEQVDFYILASVPGYRSLELQLRGLGIKKENIISSYVEGSIKAREIFVKNFSALVYSNHLKGACAEAGVYQGDFASVINEYFYDRTLYLFDTFEGFSSEDLDIEAESKYSKAIQGGYGNTSERLVLSKMKYKENCVLKKGYFPKSALDIKERFCFVNLDLDLYKPTLEGLNFFADKMNFEGLILVHDYFADDYKGVQAAVQEFLKDKPYVTFPIGDGLSIGIMGFEGKNEL